MTLEGKYHCFLIRIPNLLIFRDHQTNSYFANIVLMRLIIVIDSKKVYNQFLNFYLLITFMDF